jgi:hypothetical protein
LFFLQRGFSLVDELGFVFGVEMVSEFVVLAILISIPFLHEVDTESLVVLESHDEEITVGDSIVDGEAGGVTDSVSVWGQLGALQKDSTGLGVHLDGILSLLDDSRGALGNINLLTFSNCFEAINIFATDNVETLELGVDATFISDEVSHGFESVTISGHDNDLFFSRESTSDSGELSKCGHEDGLGGVSSGEILEEHHETAITGETTDT